LSGELRVNGRDANFYRFVRNDPVNFVDPRGFWAIDKNFPSDCLPSLQRALNIVRSIAGKDPHCNCLFTRIGDHRPLSELVDDPRIAVHYDPVQDYSKEEGITIAYTNPGDKQNIFVNPYGCLMGRWTLASALIHELTHVTLNPAPGQEEEAQLMEENCGFRKRVLTQPITVTAHP